MENDCLLLLYNDDDKEWQDQEEYMVIIKNLVLPMPNIVKNICRNM